MKAIRKLRLLVGRKKMEIAQRGEFIDVNDLLEKYSIEELLQTAEDYFAISKDNEYFLKKPFGSIEECPDLLTTTSQILNGLQLAKGMKVLDFAAGTCWLTRILTQLGCDVTATDASKTALEIGQKAFKVSPPIGQVSPPSFVQFDGYTLAVPDASMDRIVCFDAFHHIPNQETLFREFYRVLRPGGIVAFSEPGPNHSRSAQSQFEMKNYCVIERDSVPEEMDMLAKQCGFSRVEFGIFSLSSFLVPLKSYLGFLEGRDCGYTSSVRNQLASRTCFFLHKPGERTIDSLQASGCSANFSIEILSKYVFAGEEIKGKATVVNRGTAHWLPSNHNDGAVKLGVVLRDHEEKLLALDYHRILLPGEGTIAPGAEIEFEFSFPAPQSGTYIFEFDMVSENVTWFSMQGSPTRKFKTKVAARP